MERLSLVWMGGWGAPTDISGCHQSGGKVPLLIVGEEGWVQRRWAGERWRGVSSAHVHVCVARTAAGDNILCGFGFFFFWLAVGRGIAAVEESRAPRRMESTASLSKERKGAERWLDQAQSVVVPPSRSEL